jgi:hypothetical protein
VSTPHFSAKRLSLKPLSVKLSVPPRLGIVTLKGRTLAPVTRLFIDCAREVGKPLAKRK